MSSNLLYEHGSVVVPEYQTNECAALPKDELMALAQGSSDETQTFAARREIGKRVIAEIVAAQFTNQATE